MANNYRNFNFSDPGYIIGVTISTYKRTTSGKSWKQNPVEIERKIFKSENYTNYITSIPFFNNFGDGAYCRAQYGYTAAGYLPTTVTTVSPFRITKKVATFEFYPLYKMLETAGNREKCILDNANFITRMFLPGVVNHNIITIHTGLDGVLSSGDYDLISHRWIG